MTVTEVKPIRRVTPAGGHAHLYNMNGKCLSSVNANGHNDQLLVQWDCLADREDQKWSVDNQHLGSGDRHICNGFSKCVTDSSRYYDDILYQTEHSVDSEQMFTFVESLTLKPFGFT